ncbi:ergothioneine biosynthesis protein EgtB [Fulvivirga lutea]|uniref:Ergothioneine biosynthesis protein EgtB n=1 Tax=Fulvivirga lutea TaxID=2810512 RepID=A0A974WHR7_9BACT|nr:ergothioneine biosynthesis protein EgtB [Fulvivirga lutea]QSE97382.1 ergothioneine biosynthesis protein EgtB [Fulvivirga lutea]
MIADKIHISERFLAVRSQTEKICEPLKIEDYVVQPIVDVSPPKWHLGHTTWFFETFVLKPNHKGYQEFDSNYNYLFNSYYESAGARVIRTDRGNITRPGVEEVMQYRAYVNEHMREFLNTNYDERLESLIELGLQHEQQHQELLIYDIKYILGKNPLFPAYSNNPRAESSDKTPLEWLEIKEGIYEIGYNDAGFSFDNEHGYHKTYLNDFAIANRLVTNREYLEFMEAGGYENFRHWLSEAWEWVKENEIEAPEHWHRVDGQWHHYNLNGGLTAINMDAPVTHISFFEADAFAKWKGLRLPTEQEWEVACLNFGLIDSNSNFSESGQYEPVPSQNNNQLNGDCWEWTASAYRPYPYYKAPEGAVGEYNGKFMVNQMVLRGGSCATPRDHIRPTYRNFFHPHLRWMFSGIRLAKDI